MRLSTRGEYGVRAMVALARQHGGPPLSLADVAAAETISLSYLEQLVAALRRAGLVTAVRGASGGYQLARPPSDITIGDVVRPLESIALTSCTEPDGSRDCCKRRPDCATRDFWRGVNAGLLASLDNTTLADLCQAGRDRPDAGPIAAGAAPAASSVE